MPPRSAWGANRIGASDEHRPPHRRAPITSSNRSASGGPTAQTHRVRRRRRVRDRHGHCRDHPAGRAHGRKDSGPRRRRTSRASRLAAGGTTLTGGSAFTSMLGVSVLRRVDAARACALDDCRRRRSRKRGVHDARARAGAGCARNGATTTDSARGAGRTRFTISTRSAPARTRRLPPCPSRAERDRQRVAVRSRRGAAARQNVLRARNGNATWRAQDAARRERARQRTTRVECRRARRGAFRAMTRASQSSSMARRRRDNCHQSATFHGIATTAHTPASASSGSPERACSSSWATTSSCSASLSTSVHAGTTM